MFWRIQSQCLKFSKSFFFGSFSNSTKIFKKLCCSFHILLTTCYFTYKTGKIWMNGKKLTHPYSLFFLSLPLAHSLSHTHTHCPHLRIRYHFPVNSVTELLINSLISHKNKKTYSRRKTIQTKKYQFCYFESNLKWIMN